jgi:CIC family chloride channel protein
MLISALIGLMASGVVALPLYLLANFANISWYSPVFILGIGVIAVFFQRFVLNRDAEDRNYNGLSDLLIHIHSPSVSAVGLRWFVRGFVSFLLGLFGGAAGLEGAAIEWTQAVGARIRSGPTRWFEQRRRTDAAVSISAGISAAFGAPFSAVVLPMELGVGGRTLFTVSSALFAWIGMRVLKDLFSLPSFDFQGSAYSFHLMDWRQFFGVILIGILCGAVGVLTIRFIRYSQESLLSLFQTQAWIRVLAGAVLLCLVFYVQKSSHQLSSVLLEQIFRSQPSANEVAFLFITGVVSLSLLLAGFGTLGIFWPLFLLGGSLGYCIHFWILKNWVDMDSAAVLIGASSFWAALLGAPVAGALLVLELTQNFQIFLPCLVAGLIAQKIRNGLKVQSLLDEDLKARGLSLVSGKSVSVLDSIQVRDAMITDYEIVHEQEPVSEIQAKFLKSSYPFLPVVNSQGELRGLLTVDMLKEGWNTHEGVTGSPVRLDKLLEAKDLLYRNNFRTQTVKVSEHLSKVTSRFNQTPCIPVVSEDGRLIGLLFVYNVRLAYEREVAKRSFLFMRNEG